MKCSQILMKIWIYMVNYWLYYAQCIFSLHRKEKFEIEHKMLGKSFFLSFSHQQMLENWTEWNETNLPFSI